jgi:putative transposase
MKKEKFVTGGIFHVFNKSIANFGIFKDIENGQRFIRTLDYYNDETINQSFSKTLKEKKYHPHNLLYSKINQYIKFIAYCIMPDHYHLLIKILNDDIFSKYINDVENSYTRHFNLKFKRKGPLWQSDFKAVRIRNNEQLLHVDRYIHLNPTTSYLVDKPEDWLLSSCKEYFENKDLLKKYLTEISIQDRFQYKKFLYNQIDYQRNLKHIKNFLLD